MKFYPSDLTDRQWEEVAPFYTRMREYKWPKKILINAVFTF